MENVDVVLALMAAVFVMLVAIFMRQAELMSVLRRILSRTDSMAGDEERRIEREIHGLMEENRKREAIRLYRKSYGASLADSISAVEKLAQRKG